MPNQCWKCRTRKGIINPHHVNGNHNDVRKFNQITLCSKCHDLVQGICDKCSNQGQCHAIRFCNCWRFEESMPPIYFRVGVGVGGQEEENDNPLKSLNKGQNDRKSKTSIMSGTKGNLKNNQRLVGKYNLEFKIFGKCELCSSKCKKFGIGEFFYCPEYSNPVLTV